MEQRSLKLLETDKTFFSKLSRTVSLLLIPSQIGFNSVMVNIKRNSVLKAYENYLANQDSDNLYKRYEESFVLYLQSIDKYVMDSIYKKVKKGIATKFEKNSMSKYYTIINLKEKEYIEYKHQKQKYLLELDYESVTLSKKEKLIKSFNKFYCYKADTLYKGLLKHYSVQLADNFNKDKISKQQIYSKIFNILEEYITGILELKIEDDKTDIYKDILNEYNRLHKFQTINLSEKETIEKNMILLGISRKLFTHSLPLIVAEECYIKLLKDTRALIVKEKDSVKKDNAYNILIKLIEDYNLKLLSTKIYWDKQEQREEYQKFWDKYKEIDLLKDGNLSDYIKQKEVLFMQYDIKALNKYKDKYDTIIKFYKNKLTKYGVMKEIKNRYKSYGSFTKVKKMSN